MSPDFQTGLMVSIVGLSITFIALFIFIGVIMLLKAIFPYKPAQEEENAEESDGEGEEVIAEAAASEDEVVAAAIAAVIYMRGQRSNQLGAALTEARSPFWTAD